MFANTQKAGVEFSSFSETRKEAPVASGFIPTEVHQVQEDPTGQMGLGSLSYLSLSISLSLSSPAGSLSYV